MKYGKERNMKRPKYYVGVDISAENIMVAVGEEPWRVVAKGEEFRNKMEGYEKMKAWMEKRGIGVENAVVCMEATGVYGEGLAFYLQAKGYQIAVEAPLKVKRAFMPVGHKNDRVDSQQIAEYAYRYYDELVYWEPRDEILEQIKVLLAIREQYVVQKTGHLNALNALKRKVVQTPLAEALHERSIDQIKKNIKEIDAEIRRLIDEDPKYRDLIRLLMSVPGVGLLLASNMLLIIESAPDEVTSKQMAAYIGISPFEHRSGTSVYKPDSSRHYGPTRVRKLLYLASLSVRTHQPIFQKYFLRKVAEGKPKKVVLNNIANKLVKIMLAVVKTHTPYISNYHSVPPRTIIKSLT
jgi:transposase